MAGWWQLKDLLFSPRSLWRWSNLTSIFFRFFQMGWNHWLVDFIHSTVSFCGRNVDFQKRKKKEQKSEFGPKKKDTLETSTSKNLSTDEVWPLPLFGVQNAWEMVFYGPTAFPQEVEGASSAEDWQGFFGGYNLHFPKASTKTWCFQRPLTYSYCWWKKSCTTWNIYYKTMKKLGYLPYQLVQDFSHQQYFCLCSLAFLVVLFSMANS